MFILYIVKVYGFYTSYKNKTIVSVCHNSSLWYYWYLINSSIYPSTHRPIHQFTHPPVHPSTHPSNHQHIRPFLQNSQQCICNTSSFYKPLHTSALPSYSLTFPIRVSPGSNSKIKLTRVNVTYDATFQPYMYTHKAPFSEILLKAFSSHIRMHGFPTKGGRAQDRKPSRSPIDPAHIYRVC